MTASTGPGVQAGRIFTPRRIALWVIGAGLLSLSACAAPRTAPSGIPSTDAGVRPPAAAAVSMRRLPLPSTPARYEISSTAVITTRAEAMQRVDTLGTRSLVRAVAQGTAYDIVLESQTLSGGDAAPRRLVESARAVAQLTDTAGWRFAGPAADPCLTPTRAALEATRELWVRWPTELRAGSTWQDTARTTLCRDGIPLQATITRRYTLAQLPADSSAPFVITRQTALQLSGSGLLRNDPTTITGTGRSTGTVYLSPTRGWIDSLTATGTLTLEVRGATRTQLVQQDTRTQIRHAPDTP